MNSIICRLFRLPKSSVLSVQYATQSKSYGDSMKKSKKIITALPKKELPVETDTHRLQTHVCGTNLYKEEGEDVKLKADSEYPDWLWTLRTGPPPPLEEMDPNTKQYWRRLRKLGLNRNNLIKGTKKF